MCSITIGDILRCYWHRKSDKSPNIFIQHCPHTVMVASSRVDFLRPGWGTCHFSMLGTCHFSMKGTCHPGQLQLLFPIKFFLPPWRSPTKCEHLSHYNQCQDVRHHWPCIYFFMSCVNFTLKVTTRQIGDPQSGS